MAEINFDSIFKIAERKRIPLKFSISGLAGSGKTMSAIKLAKGLVKGDMGKVIFADTENSSAQLYAELGPFRHANINKPYEPEKFVKFIELAQQAGAEVIIIDSASHEWNGEGGCLDIHSKLGGKFQDWAHVTPRHNKFIEAIKQAKCHVILTFRQKEDAALLNENGKVKVVKAGLKDETREGMAYEMSIAFDVNKEHLATTSKDRTGLFMDRTPFVISEETGTEILNWLNAIK
jgi:hypothetical protein